MNINGINSESLELNEPLVFTNNSNLTVSDLESDSFVPTQNQNIDVFINSSSKFQKELEQIDYSFIFRNTLSQKFDPSSKEKEEQDNIESNQPGNKELSPEEKQTVEKLKSIDQKVKAHENAHKAAGGSLVRGAASYDYTVGPDGKSYAVGGEVQLDISYDLEKPEETIQKMQRVRQAALAPADPSSQDRSVASQSSSVEAKARQKMGDEGVDEILNNTTKNNILPEIYSKSNASQNKDSGQILDMIY